MLPTGPPVLDRRADESGLEDSGTRREKKRSKAGGEKKRTKRKGLVFEAPTQLTRCEMFAELSLPVQPSLTPPNADPSGSS
ncbi:unnamed protein product [Lampetra planeri]